MLNTYLPIDPLFRTFNTADHISCFLSQEFGPSMVLLQRRSVADDDKTVLSSSDAYIYAVLLLYKTARICSNHRNEN